MQYYNLQKLLGLLFFLGFMVNDVSASCSLTDNSDSESDGVYREYFQSETLENIARTNTAGLRLNFQLNEECQTLSLAVIDPAGDPLPPFNAVQVNPVDSVGNLITDLTDRVSVTMRVRSASAINISVLFRSGDGTMENRTGRKAIDIPGSLDTWTEFTLAFGPDELAGFNPADTRDFWFYIDRGEENFAGNFLDIDHITIGGTPDTLQNSPCSLVSVPTNFSAQFIEAAETSVLDGRESEKLSLSISDCEEINVAVADPSGNPHRALRPIIILPREPNGTAITNIDGQVEVFIRARSAEDVPLGVLFRSGDGAAENRTATLTQIVTGDLNGWSNLTYTFAPDNLGGFDAEDLVDMWVYLDREHDNFPGNELYIDYIAIGRKPDFSENSPCGLPDLMTNTREAVWDSELSISPNPTSGEITISIPFQALPGGTANLRLLNSLGQQLPLPQAFITGGTTQLQLGKYLPGTYYLLLTDRDGSQALRKLIKY